ncbi:MAG: tetratricopeptide repeat protein [Defluviitaleaceae bacterium]|nr:tetratricopeptide repeat protein [Defluviitaleaceae bacterium]
MAGLGLYYSLAQCLTVFGYANKAIELWLKTREMYKAAGDEVTLIYTNIPLAINYSRIGNYDEAMKLLNIALDSEPYRDSILGQIYHSYAIVYKAMHNYDKALEFCDKTLEFVEFGSSVYLNALYVKSEVSKLQGNLNIMNQCVDDGIKLSLDNIISYVYFKAIKHLENLNNKEALLYIIEEALPFMFDKKEFIAVIKYSYALSAYYEQCNDYENALIYYKQATKYEQKLMGDDLS